MNKCCVKDNLRRIKSTEVLESCDDYHIRKNKDLWWVTYTLNKCMICNTCIVTEDKRIECKMI